MKQLLAVVALVPALWAAPGWAASNYYLSIDSIEGGSTAEGYKKAIDVTNWSWGLTNSGSSGGGGGGTGKTVCEDFAWVQGIDKSVVGIFLGG